MGREVVWVEKDRLLALANSSGVGRETQHWTVGYRFGEAPHLGPYSEGGASSSAMVPGSSGLGKGSTYEEPVAEGKVAKVCRKREQTQLRGDRWQPVEEGEGEIRTGVGWGEGAGNFLEVSGAREGERGIVRGGQWLAGGWAR